MPKSLSTSKFIKVSKSLFTLTLVWIEMECWLRDFNSSALTKQQAKMVMKAVLAKHPNAVQILPS
jgi:hypothetical protein